MDFEQLKGQEGYAQAVSIIEGAYGEVLQTKDLYVNEGLLGSTKNCSASEVGKAGTAFELQADITRTYSGNRLMWELYNPDTDKLTRVIIVQVQGRAGFSTYMLYEEIDPKVDESIIWPEEFKALKIQEGKAEGVLCESRATMRADTRFNSVPIGTRLIDGSQLEINVPILVQNITQVIKTGALKLLDFNTSFKPTSSGDIYIWGRNYVLEQSGKKPQ